MPIQNAVAALRLCLGKQVPEEVLQCLWEYSFHLLLAKPLMLSIDIYPEGYADGPPRFQKTHQHKIVVDAVPYLCIADNVVMDRKKKWTWYPNRRENTAMCNLVIRPNKQVSWSYLQFVYFPRIGLEPDWFYWNGPYTDCKPHTFGPVVTREVRGSMDDGRKYIITERVGHLNGRATWEKIEEGPMVEDASSEDED